ncbi:MAG: uroporphyrinogen-III synthase [Spongiibacteraceae bacterium]
MAPIRLIPAQPLIATNDDSMTERSLQSLRVLVTRPQGRADALIDAIAAQGGSAVHIPLLVVEALDEQRDAAIYAKTAQRLRALDSYQRVIAISVNALHFSMPVIKKFWPRLPAHIMWYGIGAATTAAFADYGVVARSNRVKQDSVVTQDHAASTMTSEALLASAELQQLHGERILILRGVGGREQLATVLRERGAQVDYAECYRRCEPVLSAEQQTQLQAMAFDAISVNSQETLQNLWQCLPPSARELACQRALIAPSERVAAAARQLGFTQVIAAKNAGTDATINALREFAISTTERKFQQ